MEGKLTLDDLGRRETELLARVGQAKGSMEEKEAELAAAGVYTRYAEIHDEYVKLLADGQNAPEALKRAVFLVWYEAVEPACFSGLRDLPEHLIEATLEHLEAIASGGRLDEEFKAMLGWYNEVADIALGRGGYWPSIDQVLASTDSESWRTAVAASPAHELRGQLGAYWASISRVT